MKVFAIALDVYLDAIYCEEEIQTEN